MKNKSFVIGILIFVIASFALATYYSRPTEDPPAPPEWVHEVLVRPDSYVKGPADAKVTIVEFFDPECESCRAMHPLVKSLLSEYEGKVKFVYRYMPFHPNSMYAAAILEEARAQGKFEEALEILFERQPEWADHHEPRPERIKEFLSRLNLGADAFEKEAVIARHGARVERDREDGARVMVNGTPTFFVNGRMLYSLGYEPLKAAIEREMKVASE